jgi:hypothetical protein
VTIQILARWTLTAVIFLGLAGSLSGCATGAEPPPILSKQSPLALRAMQIRTFETSSKRRMIQSVIAALQDLGYTVEKIDYASGTISAAKLETLRLSIAVYPRSASQISVRANAIVKMAMRSTQVDDPGFYQKLFFEPLAKAVFLTPVQTEDDAGAPPALFPPPLLPLAQKAQPKS